MTVTIDSDTWKQTFMFISNIDNAMQNTNAWASFKKNLAPEFTIFSGPCLKLLVLLPRIVKDNFKSGFYK